MHPKNYSYLKDSNDECKKAKGTKNCVVKANLNFQDYKNCLKASAIIKIVNYLEKKPTNVDSLREDKKNSI